jgi:hypothetical protein
MFVPGKSPVKVQPEILDIFFLGSCTLFIWTGVHISLCVVNVTRTDLDPLAFILNFFKTSFGLQLGWIAVSVKHS